MFLSQLVDITEPLFGPLYGLCSQKCVLHASHTLKNMLLPTVKVKLFQCLTNEHCDLKTFGGVYRSAFS
jgi:hypothetical protein